MPQAPNNSTHSHLNPYKVVLIMSLSTNHTSGNCSKTLNALPGFFHFQLVIIMVISRNIISLGAESLCYNFRRNDFRNGSKWLKVMFLNECYIHDIYHLVNWIKHLFSILPMLVRWSPTNPNGMIPGIVRCKLANQSIAPKWLINFIKNKTKFSSYNTFRIGLPQRTEVRAQMKKEMLQLQLDLFV